MSNSVLELQRQAHEALGLGTWSLSKIGTRVTKSGGQLGVLDITNPKHPVLRHPIIESELRHLASLDSQPTQTGHIGAGIATVRDLGSTSSKAFLYKQSAYTKIESEDAVNLSDRGV